MPVDRTRIETKVMGRHLGGNGNRGVFPTGSLDHGETAGGADLASDDPRLRRARGLDQAREPHGFAERRARFGERGEIGASGEAVERGHDQGRVAGIDADHAAAGGNRSGRPDKAVAVQQHRRRRIRQQRLEGGHAHVPEGRNIRDVIRRDAGLNREVHQARPFPGGAHRLDPLGGIGRRVGVRHAHHGGHPAAGCRHRARGEGLLVRIARIAHVHVGVDEPGKEEPSAGVDYGSRLRPDLRPDQGLDPPVIADDDSARSFPRLGDETRVVYREQCHTTSFMRNYAIARPR